MSLVFKIIVVIDMGLFEVHRLVEAWPSLRSIQNLRELLKNHRQVEGVWLLQGHVIIAYKSLRNDEHEVYIFDQVPLNAVSENGCDPVGVASKIIAVLMIDSAHITIIEFNGLVHIMKFTSELLQWKNIQILQLNRGQGGVVNAMITAHGQLMYCSEDGNDEWCHSVCIETLQHQENGKFLLSDHTSLISNCPLLQFFTVDSGVWMIPSTGTTAPQNLMLYWKNSTDFIKSYIYNFQDRQCDNDLCGIKNFKVLCRRTAWQWSKQCDSRYIVSLCVHPISKHFLILLNDGTIYQLIWRNGSCINHFVVHLKDFTTRYPSPKSWYSSSSTPLQLFVCHTYFGLCLHGELRLYDSMSGEFVWECDDLDDTSTQLLTTPSILSSPVPLPVTLWNQSGIYVLQCKRITDHAQMFVDSLFPITTNADETTPGDYLDNGELLASRICHLWGFPLLSTHYTLSIAYQLLKDDTGKPATLPLSSELLSQLSELSVQNPVLCVALMTQYPVCHKYLVDQLTEFLHRYHDNEAILQTPLNAQTVPLLEHYLELSQEYESLLTTPIIPIDHTPSVRKRVKEILELSQQSTVSTDPTAFVRAELHSLSISNPSETLQGIKDFMRIEDSFSEVLQSNQYCSDINWKNLLATEAADRASQTTLKPSIQTARVPVFELTCNLLYDSEPNELLHFVAYAHLVRDLQHGVDITFTRRLRKGYFYQRAVNCISPPTSTSTTNQIKAYCQLVLSSDYPNVELQALTILLDNEMWDDAVHMMKQVFSQISPPLRCALFHRALIHFSKGDVLQTHLHKIWELLPDTFNVLDFVSVLKTMKTQEEDDVYVPERRLSVNELTPYILQLLSQTHPHKKQKESQEI